MTHVHSGDPVNDAKEGKGYAAIPLSRSVSVDRWLYSLRSDQRPRFMNLYRTPYH
jgi:hypothetical protein